LLDVVGYNLVAVPEPATVALFGVVGVGAVGAWWARRRQLQKLAEQKV